MTKKELNKLGVILGPLM